MVGETTPGCVPLLSESRYWWTSNAKFCAGSRTPGPITVALLESDEVQLQPPSQSVPGTRISCIAPALRMAAIAALAETSQSAALCTCGSFISPKITSGLELKRAASLAHTSGKGEIGGCALPINEPKP